MRLFSIGSVDKTPFGSYRVELIVQLFNRVLDQHNFEVRAFFFTFFSVSLHCGHIFKQIVLATLTPREIACLHCRIGYLKLFNPCKPDGWYQLDLSIWEERQVSSFGVVYKCVEYCCHLFPVRTDHQDVGWPGNQRRREELGRFVIHFLY